MSINLAVEQDWSRLSLVPFAGTEKVLVIDRGNGRWTYLNQSAIPLLKLLRAPEAALGGGLRPRRKALSGVLSEAGLGSAVEPPPSDLNTLILKVTKVCNYGCKYCYDMEPEDRLSHMPAQVAIAALEEALELATERLTVILHGGEPTLLFPLIRAIIEAGEQAAARASKRIVFCGQTNLSRLTAEMVSFFETHRVTWGISLDGPAPINDLYRVLANGEGTYKLFEKALHEFPDFVRRCGVLSTITASNEREMLPIARHFRDLGMQAWDWSLFQPIGMGRGSASSLAFSAERVIASWNGLFAAVESGEFDGFAVQPVLDYLENFIIGPGRNMCLRNGCGAARDLLSISQDGSIEACDCIDRKGPLANLGLVQIDTLDSLRRARSGEKAQLIRSRDVQQARCGACAWLSVCGGTCMAHADSLNGIWEEECAIAMNAFTRIAGSMARSGALNRYLGSLREYRGRPNADAAEGAFAASA